MQIHILSENNSVLNHFLGQIRNVNVHNDSMRFRRNIERIGEIMAYELSKELHYKNIEIQSPLGIKKTTEIGDQLVLCSILRAGLPLHLGFLNYFDNAENGFISAYRHHPNNDDYFEIVVQYQAIADINDKSVLLIDPMLATGQSIVAAFNKLMERGTPAAIHIAVVIAAPEGIAYLKNHLPDTCHLWIAALDEKLNEHSYIVPGLGDAGDLAFGEKL
ncbi:uracil phosphoribosyltransferase [Flavobacterium gawalongense]|uniref:Uracil phosphoribosyltransferase n=1 Tax=Flavobacterium gawalongense TaxID=2594432 RepID=A0A553BWC8_9FLAO|nr:uracil phosphoribosyltransferase [Flavobacterium gawalongense]TRX01735.1 uracil phosphoribosyltransferase [Flavobacterium gawalongense]TRX08500.1 uracil phosphoribosyltransferase [Flavobacterium gawalongense]TRX09722.1 uracil phosphoribosyltransferase [Flavobacterium gawalongense]TRX12587.1 uracil phosphoribosyltransferase [Flavobacterium gawalongense]TRX26845.1 uracil phosphoribosyltransferase [Flavobacterium gawalongense]